MRNIISAILGLVLLANNAMADDRLEGLKKMNTDLCIRAGAHVAGAPSDAKLTVPYCNCVTQTYWDSVPKSEVEELMTGGRSPSIGANLKPRMDAARSVCKKKLAF